MQRWLTTLGILGALPLSPVTESRRVEMNACQADDYVAAVELTTLPPAPRAGEAVLVSFRMRLTCPTPVMWRLEAGGRIFANGAQAAPLEPNSVVTVAATWTAERVGETTIQAVADPDNALGESDPSRRNNTIVRAVMVKAPAQPVREPTPPPSAPGPPPPPDSRGEPGSRGTCTAWERNVSGRGEGLIAIRRARGAPSNVDYAECARRLGADVMKTYCQSDDRAQLAKKVWYLQPADLGLVRQQVDCR